MNKGKIIKLITKTITIFGLSSLAGFGMLFAFILNSMNFWFSVWYSMVLTGASAVYIFYLEVETERKAKRSK